VVNFTHQQISSEERAHGDRWVGLRAPLAFWTRESPGMSVIEPVCNPVAILTLRTQSIRILIAWLLEWLGDVVGDLGVESRQGQNNFCSKMSRPVLGPTHANVEWVLGVLSCGVELTTRLHPSPRLRISGTVILVSHTPS